MTELSSGFNSIGFVASDQVKTIELSWSSSVLHLETTSGMFKVFQSYPECMFFVWLFIVGLWQMWWFGNFGAKKTTIQQQKDAVWHIISNPLDPTRRTNEDPPIPSLYWHGNQVLHLSTLHTNYMTCRYMLLLPGLELDMTFPFRPYKVCPFHSDIKTSLQLRSMGWNLANLAVTAPHRTSSTLKMSPSCQGILHHWNRPTMMSVRIPPTDEIDQASSSFLLEDERSTSLPVCFHHLYPMGGKT